jgi:hypothetical protein
VGLAIFPDDATDGPELLELADAEAIAVKREHQGRAGRRAA